MSLLRAAIRRDPGERACAALIKALEARPDAAVSGPELVLDLPLVDDYVARGMLLEARAELSGAGPDAAGPGFDRARALDELLSPVPEGAEPALIEAFRHLLTGGASLSLSLIEEHLQRGEALPPWAAHRRSVLRRLLLDRVLDSATSGAHAVTAASGQLAPGDAESDANALASIVTRLIQERDLRGAAARLQAHCASAPYDVAAVVAAAALERIVVVLDQRDPPPDRMDTRTAPMGAGKVADLNLRMGNLVEAERLYRRTLLDDPENAQLRTMLDDVQSVRRFLDSPAATAPTPHAGLTRAMIDAVVAEIAVRPTERLKTVDDAALDGSPEEFAQLYTDIGSEDDDSAGGATHVTGLPEEVQRALASAEPQRAVATSAEPTTSPVLSKKSAGPSGGFGIATGYAAAKATPPAGRSWADDDATGVVEPAVEAELLLRQGFADRALTTYTMLAQHNPSNEKFRRRRDEIAALVAAGRSPLPGDLTVRRDISELQRSARPTGMLAAVQVDPLTGQTTEVSAAPPGTLDAPGIPQGQFDDDAPTSLAIARNRPPAAKTAGDAVRVSRIIVVR